MSLFKKRKNEDPDKGRENTSASGDIPDGADIEPDVGTAEDIQAIMEKYDRESNIRLYSGIPKTIIRYLLAAFSLFAVYMNFISVWEERIRRAAFIGIIILLVFLIFPAKKHSKKGNKVYYPSIYELALGLVAALGILCFLFNFDNGWTPLNIAALTLAAACVIALLALSIIPGASGRKYEIVERRENHVPWFDVILGVTGAGTFSYFLYNFDRIIQQTTRLQPGDIIIGVIGILILFEACRRTVGIPIMVVAGAFIIYAFTTNLSLRMIIYNLFYTTTGVIGIPLGVCSTYIVLFILFGSFLEMTGISDFFIQAANSIAGASSGGPAKVAVISSALCGMVSGSSVANTVTTGSITIPLMKKTGYKPEFAGAVEAAASTGGQIMPPIMGAAAFLMADIVGVKYGTIAFRAILPAVLYFAGIFIMVHLEAKKLGLRGLKKEDLPNFFKLFITRGYLLIPLVVLVWMILTGSTMSRAAVFATLAAIAVSMFRKDTRMTPSKFVTALENGGRNTLSVAIACAVAGIISGVVTMTGLAQILISAIVAVAGNVTIIALLLTMIACIILGMGVPTTANYIIMATTCAPILVDGMGVEKIAAHMFVFYFGIIADITPPVALAAYAGSAIAKSNPMKTGLIASRLAIAAFIVPYIFVLNPAMLFINTTAFEVILIIVSSLVGIFGVSAGIEGYLMGHMAWPLRIISIAAGLLLIYPGWVTDSIGIAIVALVAVYQRFVAGKKELKEG